MYKYFPFLLAISTVLLSCRHFEPTKKPEPLHNILLVGLGKAHKANKNNLGHGPEYYIYFDLANDSVYVSYPKELEENKKFARTGRIPHLAQQPAIQDFIQSVQWEDKKSNIFINRDTCNLPFYLQYRKNKDQKTYLYNYSPAQPKILKITRYAVSLCKGNQLSLTKIALNEDSLIARILWQDEIPRPRDIEPCIPSAKPPVEFQPPLK
ncbi:MAG: hypothetical protein ACO1O1_14445 [Adhaeribacter sp.]